MKTLILSILVLTMTFGFAQQGTTTSSSQILVDGTTQINTAQAQVERLKLIVHTRKTIEELYHINFKLNQEVDALQHKIAQLENQNFALKMRNKQLQDTDLIEVAQNKKQIRHNDKLIAKNEQLIYQNAVSIQENQHAIVANKTLLLQQEQLMETVISVRN